MDGETCAYRLDADGIHSNSINISRKLDIWRKGKIGSYLYFVGSTVDGEDDRLVTFV